MFQSPKITEENKLKCPINPITAAAAAEPIERIAYKAIIILFNFIILIAAVTVEASPQAFLEQQAVADTFSLNLLVSLYMFLRSELIT